MSYKEKTIILDKLSEYYLEQHCDGDLIAILKSELSDYRNSNNILTEKDMDQIHEQSRLLQFDSESKYVLNTDKKTNLYIIGFNSPEQFQMVLESFEKSDPDFLTKTNKYLLDNSTDLETTPLYKKICSFYGFHHIKKKNLGICGGRQFIAQHFALSVADYMLFFEDDMLLNPPESGLCPNGLIKYIPDLFKTIHLIMNKEHFDFLKLSFTEFFGDNRTQWSWYNIPKEIRLKHFPNHPNLPKHGLASNPPKTRFGNIGQIGGLSYIDGEIYYCNWPQIVSKEGNQKMFLDTTWKHPYEQTWMSYIFQETIADRIHPAILLASPILHNRIHHYDGKIRREN